MATSYPAALDALTNPLPTDTLDSATVPHGAQHANANDAIEALEAKVGINGSLDARSIDYRLADVKDGLDAKQISIVYGATRLIQTQRIVAQMARKGQI